MSKKFFFLISAAFIAFSCFAQTTYFDLDATVKKEYQGYSKGDKIHIKGLVKQLVDSKIITIDGTKLTEIQYYLLLDNNNQIPISFSLVNALNYDIKSTEDLNNVIILKQVTSLIKDEPEKILSYKYGPQTRLRYELENEALNYGSITFRVGKSIVD